MNLHITSPFWVRILVPKMGTRFRLRVHKSAAKNVTWLLTCRRMPALNEAMQQISCRRPPTRLWLLRRLALLVTSLAMLR